MYIYSHVGWVRTDAGLRKRTAVGKLTTDLQESEGRDVCITAGCAYVG